MLALLSPILGIIGGLLPSIVRIFERKQELQHEIEITKIKLDAAREQAQIQLVIEGAKADTAEATAVRSFDNNVDGGKLINALRASVRPVITYTFFVLFITVKTAAAYVMIYNGSSIPDMLKAIWDPETMALFSTIMAFWFGARTLEKTGTRIAQNYNFIVEKKKT